MNDSVLHAHCSTSKVARKQHYLFTVWIPENSQGFGVLKIAGLGVLKSTIMAKLYCKSFFMV
jgi:hypothetical protein